MATTPTTCPECKAPIKNGVCVRCGYRAGKAAPAKKAPPTKPPAKKAPPTKPPAKKKGRA